MLTDGVPATAGRKHGRSPRRLLMVLVALLSLVPGLGWVSSTASAAPTLTQVDTIAVGTATGQVALSPDGSTLYATTKTGGKVTAIDAATKIETWSVTLASNAAAMAVTPDGKYLYVGGYSDLYVISTETHSVVTSVGIGGPWGIVVSPDGKTAYVSSFFNDWVKVIRTADQAVLRTVNVGTDPRGVAVSLDGSRVYVANTGSTFVSVINTADGSVTPVEMGMSPSRLVVSPDGSKVYAEDYSPSVGVLKVIRTSDNSVTATVTGLTNAAGLALSPDGSQVYVSHDTSGKVTAIDAASIGTGLVEKTVLSTGGYPTGMAVSRDGSRLYVADYIGTSIFVLGTGVTLPAPTVSSVSPASGPLAGGGSVTIAGSGFLAGATVAFGGTPATGVSVGSGGTSITATVPAGSAGAVNVVVSNPGPQSVTATGAYTYVDPPVKSAQTVSWAPTQTLKMTDSPWTPDVWAASDGDGAISYAVTDAGTAGCSWVAGNLAFTGAGSCVVAATAAETDAFAAGSKAVTFTVEPAAETGDCAAVAGNLLTNCGFENDLSSWVFTPASDGSFAGRTSSPTHSGGGVVRFGAVGGLDDVFSQQITGTVSGTTYQVRLWVKNSAGSDSHLGVEVSGTRDGTVTLFSETNAPSYDWKQVSGLFVAGEAAPVISIGGRNGDSYYVDDVSVSATLVNTPPAVSAGADQSGQGHRPHREQLAARGGSRDPRASDRASRAADRHPVPQPRPAAGRRPVLRAQPRGDPGLPGRPDGHRAAQRVRAAPDRTRPRPGDPRDLRPLHGEHAPPSGHRRARALRAR